MIVTIEIEKFSLAFYLIFFEKLNFETKALHSMDFENIAKLTVSSLTELKAMYISVLPKQVKPRMN